MRGGGVLSTISQVYCNASGTLKTLYSNGTIYTPSQLVAACTGGTAGTDYRTLTTQSSSNGACITYWIYLPPNGSSKIYYTEIKLNIYITSSVVSCTNITSYGISGSVSTSGTTTSDLKQTSSYLSFNCTIAAGSFSPSTVAGFFVIAQYNTSVPYYSSSKITAKVQFLNNVTIHY
jgi:hypothetical protein